MERGKLGLEMKFEFGLKLWSSELKHYSVLCWIVALIAVTQIAPDFYCQWLN